MSIVLHEFNMGDVEDPYLYAAHPIYQWQQTEKGKWVMEHALDKPVFHCLPNRERFGYRVVISGDLSPKDQTYYFLKWGTK